MQINDSMIDIDWRDYTGQRLSSPFNVNIERIWSSATPHGANLRFEAGDEVTVTLRLSAADLIGLLSVIQLHAQSENLCAALHDGQKPGGLI